MIFLQGERLYLRPLEETDADGEYPAWLNDRHVCAGNSHHVYPYPRRKAREYIRALDGLTLAVVTNEHEHIGNISLASIHPVSRSAEFAILLGSHHGKGYGYEAARLIVAHGFSALNLHRIWCGTFSTNKAMRALAAKLGMREEGVRRQAVWKDGVYVDVHEFGVLREEFV